ncbi:MAG: septum formation initiator family protein [Clostridiaceae bacterium]|nr:septum formation initiator family protein [Eubacteriales bacterium]
MAKGKRKLKVRFRFAALAFLAGACVVGAVFWSQEQKLAEIRREQASLQAKYDALQNEKQRTELMIEYARSEEYLLEYAREKLGFIKEGETQFEIIK